MENSIYQHGYDNLDWNGDCVAGRKGNLLSARMKKHSKLHIFQNP